MEKVTLNDQSQKDGTVPHRFLHELVYPAYLTRSINAKLKSSLKQLQTQTYHADQLHHEP